MDRNAFGRLLREARQRSLFTLERLAETSGVSVRAISDMERGKSLPRRSTLSELMDALELDEQDRRGLVRASTRRTTQAPQQLPPDLAVFRGREKALETARGSGRGNAERDAHGGVVVIAGMAGVGKTTLAVHWAHRVAGHFPDGRLYVNLRGFDDSGRPLDPGDVLGGFLTALGVPTGEIPRRTGERGALFRERTASLRLIVVLDNARDAEQVAPLLPAASGCLTVVTSRNRLSDLATDSEAALIGLDVWTPDEALTALAARIGDERCRAEPEAAADLVALCGHLPLAVAVVGAQLSAAPRMPLRVAARELREELPRLDALSAGDQRVDLRTVFSWSYRALPQRTARFFRHLALHPGPALTAESAASLAGTGMAEARRHLRELTSASLLSQDAEGRHVLHDLVRAYGTELIEQEQDDRIGAEIRLLDYLRHTAHDASHVLDPRPRRELADPPAQGVVRVETRNREEALDWFRQEEATVAAALRTLEDPRLLRHRTDLVDDWVSYYAVKGRWTEEIAVRRIGVEASRLLDEPVALSKNCAHLARALAESGRLEEADAQVRTMLGLLDRLDPAQRAATERSIGWVRGRQGRHTDALHHARNALALFRALGDEGSEARELNAVGWYLALLGEYREAITMCEAAVPLLRRTGNRRSEAATWDSIGYARQRLGDLDTAVADYETSLRLYAEVLDDYNQAEVLDHLASAHAERGDPDRARTSWTRAADLLTALHDPRAPDLRAKAESPPPPLPHPDAGTAGQEGRQEASVKNALTHGPLPSDGVPVVAPTRASGRPWRRSRTSADRPRQGETRMIVVSAASGALGRLVVDRLLALHPADRVAAAVRRPDRAADLAARGVEVRHADYDEPATLRTAFAGADRLLLISSPELDPARRTAQHRAAVDAARASGVRAVVYTSFLGADGEPDALTAAHHATEQALKAGGLTYTLLRHPFYTEAFVNPGLRGAVTSGELLDGTRGRGLNTATRADLAEAAARVLTEDHHAGRAYDFTGTLWTFPQLAEALTRISGTPVAHRERPEPAEGVQGWLESRIAAGALERQTGDLAAVLGHPPTSLDQAVTAALLKETD